MIDTTILHIILIVFIVSLFCFLTYKKFKYAIGGILVLVPLMHKEFFSLYQWDFLPVRFAILGVLLGLIILQTRRCTKNHFHFKFLTNALRHLFLDDRVLMLLITVLVVKISSLILAGNLTQNLEYIAFFSIAIILYAIIRYAYNKFGADVIFYLLKVYMGIGLVAVLFAYVQMFLYMLFGIKIGAIWPVANNLPRLGSSFWDVNHFGGFLVTLIPLYFVFTFISNKKIYKIASLLGVSLSSLMLFLTQSRSSWLGLAVALGFGVSIFAFKKYFKVIGLIALGIGVMLIVFFTYLDFKDLSVRQKIRNYMHYRLDSTDGHMMLLEGAVYVYMDNMLLGTGSGNFDQAFRKTEIASRYFEKEPNIKNTVIPPHSVWGEIISENGYVGFVVYLFMMFFVLAGLFKIAISSDATKKTLLASGLFISLFGILVAGIFYSFNLEFYWFIFIISSIYAHWQLQRSFNFIEVFRSIAMYRYTPYVVIFSIGTIFIFLKLAGATLLEWDEAIYAKVVKNMYMTGDWLNLRWPRAQDLWLEKPPLYMWLTNIVFNLIGPDEFAARFWAATFGVLGLIVTYILGKKLFNRFTGTVAALILLTTVHYLYYARNSILDVPVTFFILTSVTLFVYALETKKSLYKYLLAFLAGIFVGLGVMTKAIVGLIPIAIIFLYLFVISIKIKKIWGFKIFVLVLFGMLLTALPWHIYSYQTHGFKFIDVYFLQHIFDRSTQGLGHVQPIWWYFDVLRASLRIWIFGLVGALFLLPFIDHKKRSMLLIYIAVLFIFTFFSIPADKLLWYLVPIYPFTAILIARFIDRGIEQLKLILRQKYVYKVAEIKLLFVIGLLLFVPFYITTIRDKVFFEDENRDIVELIKVHNEIYPVQKYPNFNLRYSRVPYTVALYYSDHEPKYVSTEDMINILDDAKPDEFYTFLITQVRYYQLKELMKVEIDIPSDLRVKASSGEYVIARSYSQIELIEERMTEINADLTVLGRKQTSGTITDFELNKLKDLRTEYDSLYIKLTEYAN